MNTYTRVTLKPPPPCTRGPPLVYRLFYTRYPFKYLALTRARARALSRAFAPTRAELIMSKDEDNPFVNVKYPDTVGVPMKDEHFLRGSTDFHKAAALFNFDEVDKLSESSARAQEIVALLIHLTDPASNDAIHDRYLLNVPLDFSRATFIFTMNDERDVSPVLLDRMNLMRMEKLTHLFQCF